MDFDEFIMEIRERIPDYLMKYDIEAVRVETVVKNNGISLKGLIVCLKGEELSPNIYLDYYYELYKEGRAISDVLEMIRDEYELVYNNLYNGMPDCFDIHNIKDRIFLRLVNYNKNKQMLEEVPYIPFFDLAVTFRYLVKQDDEGVATAILKNRELAELELDMEELYMLARKNTERLFPYQLMLMGEMLSFDESEAIVYPNMYVLTNNRRVNGATYMVYQDVLSDFADRLAENFYIIPSSIHELLLIPESDMPDVDTMKQTIGYVNEHAVSEMDYLSDSLYYYDRDKRIIKICV